MLLGMASCNYLDKEPENTLPASDVDYTNISNMYEPVSGAYAKLRTGGMHWVIWGLTIVRDDDVWSGRVDDQATLVDYGERYNYDNSFWALNEFWNQYYGMVKVCNSALLALDNYAANITSTSDKATYNSYCGEVRFLRAYAYYRLVEAFGPVTILRTNDQTNMQRSSIDLVQKYMLEDLQFAMDNLPKVRPNEMAHIGAVSAYSAEMLAAKIHLNRAEYSDVETLTNDIINSGKFELYSDFYELFKIPGKLCNESLFECQTTDFGNSSGELVDADQWFPFQGPANDGNISGWGFIGLTKNFQNWAAARGETVRATTSFLHANSTTPSGDSIRPQGNTTATDCWNGKAYTPLKELTPGQTKYGCNNNIRIFRYAEVLLMNAEAKVRLGKSGDEPFNKVRVRAKMPTITGVTVDQILDERRMELCCEWGARYQDLIRTGKAASVLTSAGGSQFGATTWTTDKTYYPVPYNQLSISPDLALDPLTE